jgi:hypothetical protein
MAMAISNASVVRAQCDACPQVVYAEAPARPKGFTGHIQEIDGLGRETNAYYFACQAGHVGKAAQNALKATKNNSGRGGAPAPSSLPVEAPVSSVTPASFGGVPLDQDPVYGDNDEDEQAS